MERIKTNEYSEYSSERVEGDVVDVTYPFSYVPIRPGSIEIYYDDKVIDRDDGKGKFTWLEGRVDYYTGQHSIRVPTSYRWELYASYDYESGIAEEIIRRGWKR
jgi:hypothetical protein